MRDLILFSGQSNMQGQSEELLPMDVPGALEYRWLEDRLRPLQDPVGEDIRYDHTPGKPFDGKDQTLWLQEHLTGSACYGHTSLVPAFCRAYIAETGREVVAAHIAKGSTCITDWLPGSPGYEILIQKASAAKLAAEAEHLYFVWLQGESDAVAASDRETYTERLLCLQRALKHDLGIDLFGIIRVGRFTGDQRDDAIIAAQREVCRRPEFRMLTELADEVPMNPYVKGHFSAVGLRQLGDAAGTALGAYKKEQ